MTEAIGYTRLSQESDTSLENQAVNIRSYAEQRGFDLQEIVSDGELASGFAPDELGAYQTVRERVRAGEVDAVIANDKRRWPRDENEVMRFVADLRDQGVELHTHLNGQVDLSDPMDAAIEIMRASVAAEEKREEIEKAAVPVRTSSIILRPVSCASTSAAFGLPPGSGRFLRGPTPVRLTPSLESMSLGRCR